MPEDPKNLTAGSVVRWSVSDGHGVLVSPAVDGHVFAHYSMIRDQERVLDLAVDQRVWFTWERVEQDGCPYRAIDLFTTEEGRAVSSAPRERGHAYTSSLTVKFDDETASQL